MNGQLDFDGREERDDPEQRIVDQLVGRFRDGAEIVVTSYTDGTFTAAKRRVGDDRFEQVVELRSWGAE